MDIDISRKLIRCVAPFIMAEMLLSAASALFSYAGAAEVAVNADICGIIMGHVLIALMCVFMLRGDAVAENFSISFSNTESETDDGRDTERLQEENRNIIYSTKPTKPTKPEKPEKPDKPEKPERTENVERTEKEEKAENTGSTEKQKKQKKQKKRKKQKKQKKTEDIQATANKKNTGISRKIGISPAETTAWMVGACALCLITTYLLNALGMTGADDAYIRAALVTEKAPAALRVLLVLLIAPVSEEFLYRGIVYGRVTECFGERTGFAASVAAFAISHGNLTQGIYACVTGVLLTAACRRVRNPAISRLWLCILLHITINACSLMVFK